MIQPEGIPGGVSELRHEDGERWRWREGRCSGTNLKVAAKKRVRGTPGLKEFGSLVWEEQSEGWVEGGGWGGLVRTGLCGIEISFDIVSIKYLKYEHDFK